MMKRAARGTALAAFAALTVGSCGSTPTASFDPAEVTGDFDWTRYDGTSISVMLNAHPWSEGVAERLSEFQALTGIEVELQTYTEDQYFDKMEQAVRSSAAPDVYMLPMDDSVVNQYAADLIDPLTPYVENPALTSAEYDYQDIPRGLLDSSAFTDDEGSTQDYQIPIVTEAYILFYNKDLVDEYEDGVVPGTMEGLIASAKRITAEANGEVFGSVMRGTRTDTLRDTLTGVVLNQVPLDQDIELPYNIWFDGSWDNPVLDDPFIVQGMSDYAELVKQGPSNRFNIDWQDATSLFSQGKVAYYIDASTFGPMFEDPSQSTIAGRVGYAEIPVGEQQGSSAVWSWGINIAKNATNKGAGWLFIQWATGKDMTAYLGSLTGAASRLSSAGDPVYTESLDPEFVSAVEDALARSRTSTVQREGWKAGAFVIVDAMLEIASGSDPAEVMSDANEEMKSAIE